MQRIRTISVTLFILGLGLVILGTYLSDYSQVEITGMGGYTTYPYRGLGAATIVVSLVVLSVAYILSHRLHRTPI